jgi:hypothetical protein
MISAIRLSEQYTIKLNAQADYRHYSKSVNIGIVPWDWVDGILMPINSIIKAQPRNWLSEYLRNRAKGEATVNF